MKRQNRTRTYEGAGECLARGHRARIAHQLTCDHAGPAGPGRVVTVVTAAGLHRIRDIDVELQRHRGAALDRVHIRRNRAHRFAEPRARDAIADDEQVQTARGGLVPVPATTLVTGTSEPCRSPSGCKPEAADELALLQNYPSLVVLPPPPPAHGRCAYTQLARSPADARALLAIGSRAKLLPRREIQRRLAAASRRLLKQSLRSVHEKAMSPQTNRCRRNSECPCDRRHALILSQHEDDAATQHGTCGERPAPCPSEEPFTIGPGELHTGTAPAHGGFFCNMQPLCDSFGTKSQVGRTFVPRTTLRLPRPKEPAVRRQARLPSALFNSAKSWG